MKLKEAEYKAKGFTIIELLIATSVFSVVLLILTTGLLQVGRLYYKGITSSQVQETTRSIMDEVTRAIQFSGGRITPISGGPPSNYFCIGDKRYSFLLNRQLVDSITDPAKQSRRVLVSDDDISCSTGQNLGNPAGLTSTSKELLAPRTWLTKFDICLPGSTPTTACPSPSPPNSNLYQVTIKIISGDSDLIDPAKDTCIDGRDGTQFCAVSELSTTVLKLIK